MKVKRITRQEISYRINVSPYGFDKMIANKTMKVEILEKISQVLEVDMKYWWEENPSLKNGNIKTADEKYEFIKKQLDVKDKQIEFLQGLIVKNKTP